RNCWSFCSRRTRSTLSAERKRSLSLRPSRRFFSSTWAKAPPLPGLTWSVLTATQRPPSCSMMLPGRISFPLILGISDLGGRDFAAPYSAKPRASHARRKRRANMGARCACRAGPLITPCAGQRGRDRERSPPGGARRHDEARIDRGPDPGPGGGAVRLVLVRRRAGRNGGRGGAEAGAARLALDRRAGGVRGRRAGLCGARA